MSYRPRRLAPLATLGVLVALLLSACGEAAQGGDTDPDQVDSVEVPELGACRVLSPEDVAQASNATRTVDCTERHTAQTYAVGELPEEFEDVARDDPSLGEFAYRTCSAKFLKFLGADESMVMRTVVNWAWFRPSEKAWEDGARWYRCDVVGGGEQSDRFVTLPTTAEGLLLGRPQDRWMVCVAGQSVTGSPRTPCNEPHDWRAVSAIKLGEPEEPYPGDRVVEVKTRDFCSTAVGAWLNYPVNYDFAYTWFHEAEWEAGNRRSVCWAKTPD
ncbi:septum formation family protein [Nocardioides sp. cx-173]|uniref:septum formation family protein n=1 Tax=Nocardioides sp. cx-173 TaxID=2898796 RepID=UPI001E5E4161|nr:septum formation family protein [Nocardioides sp. cx-173]MCD4527178.1 septum formation family protein [Nocardioides sp. cx-173]UGB40465.1 septum formation family protein [Nocardioides sp. cx-173]